MRLKGMRTVGNGLAFYTYEFLRDADTGASTAAG